MPYKLTLINLCSYWHCADIYPQIKICYEVIAVSGTINQMENVVNITLLMK